MAYDERLTERVLDILGAEPSLVQKKMFALADALHKRSRLVGQEPVVWSTRQIVYEPASDLRTSHS